MGRLFLLLTEFLEDRHDGPDDQRQRHEHGREHHARHGEDDLDAMPLQPPAFATAMMASGENPSTIRKNCSTSL